MLGVGRAWDGGRGVWEGVRARARDRWSGLGEHLGPRWRRVRVSKVGRCGVRKASRKSQRATSAGQCDRGDRGCARDATGTATARHGWDVRIALTYAEAVGSAVGGPACRGLHPVRRVGSRSSACAGRAGAPLEIGRGKRGRDNERDRERPRRQRWGAGLGGRRGRESKADLKAMKRWIVCGGYRP